MRFNQSYLRGTNIWPTREEPGRTQKTGTGEWGLPHKRVAQDGLPVTISTTKFADVVALSESPGSDGMIMLAARCRLRWQVVSTFGAIASRSSRSHSASLSAIRFARARKTPQCCLLLETASEETCRPLPYFLHRYSLFVYNSRRRPSSPDLPQLAQHQLVDLAEHPSNAKTPTVILFSKQFNPSRIEYVAD